MSDEGFPRKKGFWNKAIPADDTFDHDTVIHELAKHFGDLKGKRVLDVGCGNGSFLKRLEKETGAIGYGVDGAQRNVSSARRRGLTRVVKGNIVKLRGQFRRGTVFDAVVSSFVMEPFVLTKAEAERAIRAARRLTKPGGVHVYLTEGPNHAAEVVRTLRMKVLHEKRFAEFPRHVVVARKPER